MKHYKKISALTALLVLTGTLSGAVGCGKTDDVKTNNPSSTDSTDNSAETTKDEYGYIAPDIQKKDYGGREFHIIYPSWSLYNSYFFASEENGDIVNDSIYERTRRVEEMFNIKIVSESPGYVDSIYPAVQKAVFSDLPDYDLVLTHCATSLTSYVSDNILLNWNGLPCVDLDKPYWNQSVRVNFEVGGMLPFMSSDYILPDVNSIFFNKKLIEDNSLEDPYDITLAGKWTWDKLREMAAKGSADLNGDSVMDAEDQYGFACERGWQTSSVLSSCGQMYFAKNADGFPELAANNEKTQNILEMFCGLLYRENISFSWQHKAEYDPNQGGKPPVDFGSGRSMFYLTPLSLAVQFRSTEVDYGILPFPKYDENQKDYITLNWAGFMCVPASVADKELVGSVAEMLAAESCRTVIPAFKNVLLGEKIARDERAKEILDIIFTNDIYDLGVNLGYSVIMSDQVANDSPDNVKYIKTKQNAIDKAIEDYINSCTGEE